MIVGNERRTTCRPSRGDLKGVRSPEAELCPKLRRESELRGVDVNQVELGAAGQERLVLAFDAATGEVAWTRAMRDHLYASLAEAEDGTVIQPSVDGGIWALEPKDGAVKWVAELADGFRSSAAIDHDELAIAFNGFNLPFSAFRVASRRADGGFQSPNVTARPVCGHIDPMCPGLTAAASGTFTENAKKRAIAVAGHVLISSGS